MSRNLRHGHRSCDLFDNSMAGRKTASYAPGKRTLACAGALVAAALLAGCAHAPLNQPTLRDGPKPSFGYVPRPPDEPADGVVVFLFFSGGGTRAAALSYGVLKELAQTPIPGGSSQRRLLDDVESVSAVSGASFTAAYYCPTCRSFFSRWEPPSLRRPDSNGVRVFFAPALR